MTVVLTTSPGRLSSQEASEEASLPCFKALESSQPSNAIKMRHMLMDSSREAVLAQALLRH